MKIVVKALIYDPNNNVLVLKRSGTHPNYAHEVDLPGGEVESSEDVFLALIREIKEETKLLVQKRDIVLGRERISGSQSLHRVYKINVRDIKPQIKTSWEHESYEWIAKDSIISHLIDAKDDYMIVVRELFLSEEEARH